MLPTRLSHYLVLEKIGAGGMGVVYRAHDESLDRDVALKVLPPRASDDGRSRARFRREALALAKLNHPNIGSIYEFGSDGETDFLVMELVSGVSLDEKLTTGPVAEKEVLRLGAQLADGLEAAHKQGIVHRDLKPSNVRLTEDNRLKILDFGIAQWVAPEAEAGDVTVTRTSPNELVGTLAYMAPEQIRGQKADARTDIYSAGVVLYEMTTGKRPYADTSGPQLIGAILEQAPSPPSSRNHAVSPVLESIILKALDKDPDRRYQSAQELRIDLERLYTGSGSAVRVRKRPRWPVAAALGILLLIGAAAWHAWRQHEQLATSNPATGRAGRKSVAVMGFKNLSGKPEDAWLSAALAEMLTTELSAGEQLRMIPGENVARMKRDLGLPDADSFSNETLARIRNNLGSDLVVAGSYLESGGQLRLDFHVQDARAGETLASFSKNGDAEELLDLISQTGTEARDKLALAGITPADRAELRAALPANTDAARLYSEGLEKLRVFEFVSARDLLQKATAVDSSNALTHSALAAAWAGLGYDTKARDEARTAFELSGGLPREARLLVEGRYREITHDWPKAREIYRTLWNFFPDNLEYGLRLATVQIQSTQAKDALTTLDQLRKLPAPEGADPRIDLAQADAAASLADFHQEEQAAGRALQKAESQGAQEIMAQALLSQAWALDRLGSMEPAMAAVARAQSILESGGHRGGAAHALVTKGDLLYDKGDFSGAQAAFEEALKVFQEIGARGQEAQTLNSIGNVLYDNGQLDQAKSYYERTLAIDRELGARSGIAGASGNLANVLDSLGDLKGSRQKQAEALQAFRDVHDRRGEASTLNNLGNVLAELGNLRGARERYEQSMAVQDQIGYRRGRGFSLQSLADILREEDKFEEARVRAEESAALRRELGDQNNLASSQTQLAQIALDQGQYDTAEELARPAVDSFAKIKSVQGEANALSVIALAQLHTGKLAEATTSAGRAVQLAQQAADRMPRFLAAVVAARVQAANGHVPEAIHALQGVRTEATSYGYLAVEFEARLALGEMEKLRTPDSPRAQLKVLAKEARAKGYLRLARLAQAAETGS